MGKIMTKKSEDQRWLESIQKKFAKLINSPYWDCIELSQNYIDIISLIMNTKDVNNLSPLINERLTDNIFECINTKIKKAKEYSTEK